MAEDQTNRRLAAILAADVVGYSRMMGADEAGTLTNLKRHREMIFDPAVAAHKGRVVKLIGDGTLVEFGSVVDAVKCALAIQRAIKAAAHPDGRGIQFHGIGSVLMLAAVEISSAVYGRYLVGALAAALGSAL